MSLCKKREPTPFALNFQIFSVRCDFNPVYGLACQSIGGAKNLNWTDKIEFVDGWHDKNDYVASGPCSP